MVFAVVHVLVLNIFILNDYNRVSGEFLSSRLAADSADQSKGGHRKGGRSEPGRSVKSENV